MMDVWMKGYFLFLLVITKSLKKKLWNLIFKEDGQGMQIF